ncbi:hypothetical protein PVAND_003523 [Polypedilum vanderplanki]|uniref:Tudor domain-containing protein n=1 Tax=Polypedilum vanderplanki TaxID=319348 RepID=A0A9J6BUB0_POLVA|nr:hypothetical protein PVAND_003523 [Polypedilum vanderplanki]
MDRVPSDETLTESIKSLIISRNTPVTIAQLQRDYEELEGRKIPELKLQQLLKYNKTFHYLKPQNGQEEKFDVRYGARMNRVKPQRKFSQPPVVAAGRALKNPIIQRNRFPMTSAVNNLNINNNNIYQKNFNGNVKPIQKLTTPLSERLKRKGELSPEDIEVANNLNIPDTWFISPGNSFDKLTKYCQMKNIDLPEVKFLNNPLTKGSFKCQVTVNGKTYASYNDFFSTKSEAQEASCIVAINELKREEELSKNPLDSSNSVDIAQRIWQMIRNSIGGVFFKHIANLYIENYKLSLPENWSQHVVKPFDGQLFKLEINAFNEEILFAIGDGIVKEEHRISTFTEPTQNIPELEFPWKDKLWNVFVTNAFSPTDISARLIGSDYSDALDKLLNDIEIIMMSKKEKPTEIKVNYVYLTSIAECWHRIRVVEINDKEVNVICIDNGDYEWISIDDIYVCKQEFLTIAPQAFKVSLFGLEEFESGLNLTQLFEPLNYKSLVAEIMMTKEAYDTNKSKIKMILYDTSTDEDINLNESLMNSILQSVTTPTLSQKDSNQIIITNIGEDGIFCQLSNSSAHIQQLINNISKEELAQYRGLYADKSDKKKVYLIYDGRLKNWFRARIEKLMDSDSHLMYTIDHGYKTLVNVQDIYRLDKVSYVLSLYPSQVLKFGLFNVPFTEENRKRLLGLLPIGRSALAKVVTMSANNIPQVNLFVYITHNSESLMCNINEQFVQTLGPELQATSQDDAPLIKLERRQLKNNGGFITVFVSLVSSPMGFIIQLQDDLKELNGISNDLQKYCNISGKFTSLSDIQKGEVYAVYDEDSQKWIRASVESVIDQHFINCLFVDSGNFKTISLDKMRILPNKFRALPKLAMKARLYGVKPKYRDFSPDDAIYFKKLTENKSFPAVIKNIHLSDPYEKQEVYEVVLFGKNEKIHETLIKDGRALAN